MSAQPTDEVFIQIRPRLYYDRREIKMTVAIVTGRDSAKKTNFVLNAVSSNYAAVGAAIGRPSVNIRGDEK